MAQAHQPHLLGTAPKSFNGSANKAIAFWNTLENYYTTNATIYDTEDKKISAALTHFKLGTQAGEWASNRMAAALAAAPQTYRTWATFKADFKAQFIPPQMQLRCDNQDPQPSHGRKRIQHVVSRMEPARTTLPSR
jgi:hypothetical protein